MLTWLRWLLVVPAAWGGWAVAVISGMGVYTVLERLCPADQVISGMCVAPWFAPAAKAVFCGGAGLAAGLIVAFATLVAPAHRRVVALLAFALGCLAALVMGVKAEAYAELVTALIAGLLTTWWLRVRPWTRQPSVPGVARPGA